MISPGENILPGSISKHDTDPGQARPEGMTWTKCGNGYWRGYTSKGKLYIVAPRNGFRAYSADASGWCGPWSKNQAEAKKICEAHYRAALFGSDGPTVRIVAATTPAAAPSGKQANNQGKKPHCGGTE